MNIFITLGFNEAETRYAASTGGRDAASRRSNRRETKERVTARLAELEGAGQCQ